MTPRKPWWRDSGQWRKGQAALAGAVGIIASNGFLAGTALHVANTVIAVAAMLLVVFVPNDRVTL